MILSITCLIGLMSLSSVSADFIPIQSFSVTASGLHRDVNSGTNQQVTLDLIYDQNPTGDWHTISGQSYTVAANFTSSQATLKGLYLQDVNGNTIASATSQTGTTSLSVNTAITSSTNCKWHIELEYDHKTGEVKVKVVWDCPVDNTGQRAVDVTVLNEATGNPWSGCTVILQKTGGSPVSTQTDAQGKANFNNLARGEYTCTVYKGGSMASCKMVRNYSLNTKRKTQLHDTYVISQHYSIQGKIALAGGASISYAQAHAQKGSTNLNGIINQTPDGDGKYLFIIPGAGAAPDPGDWTVTITYSGPGTITINPTSRTVTVPNNCSTGAGAQSPYGSHSIPDAGLFTITRS
ncbi:MAG: carboxypeptidase regulatory-like domain-containing protein [Armatimonadetes bacterium]|nr:carboxypeptidase regulatory-like domain-containing protein [Armatimonadota bacterium]